MSLDGKISTSLREQVRFSSHSDWEMLDELRARTDAIVVGAGTIRAETPPIGIKSPDRQAERIRNGKSRHPLSLILSRSLDLPLDRPFFQDNRISRLVVSPTGLPSEKVDKIKPYAEIRQFGKESVDLNAMCCYLKNKGIQHLLVEGGGDVNMAFFRAGLMDEIYVTLCPIIIGGRAAPTPVDGNGFSHHELQQLELLNHNQIDQEIFLHYRVKKTSS